MREQEREWEYEVFSEGDWCTYL